MLLNRTIVVMLLNCTGGIVWALKPPLDTPLHSIKVTRGLLYMKLPMHLLFGNLATQLPAHQYSLMATRAIPRFCLSPGTAQRQRNPEVKRFIRAALLFSQHL